MRLSRVPIADKRGPESKKNHNSSQRKATLSGPKVTRKKFLVNMVNTRSVKEHKMKESAVEGPTVPAIEINLETPDQSVDEVEKKTMESTPMPNAEEQEKKTIEFSPIDIVEDTTDNTPETIKEDSQTKRTSFVHTENCSDGRNETKRERGGGTNDREKQNIWNSFRKNNRGQTSR